MPNFDTDYRFSPRVREIIEARMGAKMGLTHARVEILINDVYDGKNIGGGKYTTEDKSKIMFYLSDFSPNKHDNEEMDRLAEFLKNSFDNNEIRKFVTDVVMKSYHPGMVLYNVRVYNTNITYFVSRFSELFKMSKGIVVNTKFIGDVIKVYPGVMYDEGTGEITDPSTEKEVDGFVKRMKKTHGRKLKVFKKGDVVVLASNKDSVINDLSTYKLNIEDIPEFYFEC
jgi:hypothetical protein